MNFNKIYALGLRHLYLIMNSFPRVLDLIYWPTVQIFLWGFMEESCPNGSARVEIEYLQSCALWTRELSVEV